MKDFIFSHRRMRDFGTLVAKINSTKSNWKIDYFGDTSTPITFTDPTSDGFTGTISQYTYTIIDNANGAVVKQSFGSSASGSINADLSSTSGDLSLYIKDVFNVTFKKFADYNQSGIYWLDLSLFQGLEYLYLNTGQPLQILNVNYTTLKDLTLNRQTITGFNFAQTSNLTNLVMYSNVVSDLPIDISNNANLLSFYSNVAAPYFNPLNHPNLTSLNIYLTTYDTRINNQNLPNLGHLTVTGSYLDYDFSQIDLTKVTALSIYAKSLLNFDLLTSLTYLNLKPQMTSVDLANNTLQSLYLNSYTDLASVALNLPELMNLYLYNFTYPANENINLDLKPMKKLVNVQIYYGNKSFPIDFANGLNANVNAFKITYNTAVWTVTVDDPVKATNREDPYLSTKWSHTSGIDYLKFTGIDVAVDPVKLV